MARSRNWVFTLNNYTEEQLDALRTIVDRGLAKYIGFQPERGANGTPHLQGCVVFGTSITLGAAKARMPGQPHLERMLGTFEQARDYCRKVDSRDGAAGFGFGEFGDPPLGQGTRTDFEHARDVLRDGGNMRDLAESHPSLVIRYGRGLQSMQSLFASPRDPAQGPAVKWFWGPTGSGKSRAAFEEAGDHAYYKMPGNKWWDGYEQQPVVVIDDYRRDMCTFSELLRLLDRYPHRVEMKGASIQFSSTTIIITSPKDPACTWEGRSDEDIAQLVRRVTEVRHFPGEVVMFPIFEGNVGNH